MPHTQMAIELMAPWSSPISMALVVPSAWLHAPVASPCATGSVTRNHLANRGANTAPTTPASTTAAANVGQFDEAMRRALDAGKDILCICFSGALSTTYQSACIAAEDLKSEYPDAKIVVIDSLSASRGQGMLLYRTVQERRRSSPDIETLAAYVRSILQTQCHWFIVDDLNHLKRGGRVSATAAFVGTMLGIKPVMHTDSEGRLIPMSKARGTKAALKALVDKVEELGVEPDKNQPLFICHANCPDSVAYVKELLEKRFGVTDVRADFIGPVIGAHTGCGTLGLFFVGTQR